MGVKAFMTPVLLLILLSIAGFVLRLSQEYNSIQVALGAAERIQSMLVKVPEVVSPPDPLPMKVNSLRPTTGYDDVKSVAVARLAATNIPVIQVDWLRYGHKLAQVALTFGADDLDEVPASDESPDGRRRAPLEEVRRNIEAAGFVPAERDGRFALIA